jgi:hypothetical protein
VEDADWQQHYRYHQKKSFEVIGGFIMKKNPGRAERRRLFFNRRRAAGKQRAKMNEYISSHKFLKKFQEV